MKPRSLKFVTNKIKAEQKDPEIVFSSRGIELSPLAAGALGLQRLGRDGQDELDVRLDLACVQTAIEQSIMRSSA